ncbi:MAG: DoxX family membrane protein [Sphingomonadaceae bacterium]
MRELLGLNRMVPLAFLVPLRLFLGASFVFTSLSKIREGWLSRPVVVTQPTARTALASILDQFAHVNPYPPYKRFLLQVVIPKAEAFRYLIVLGELAIGLSLFTGTLARVGAFFGIVANTNYLLMKGLDPNKGLVDLAFITGESITLLADSGRTLGVDALLRHKWPRFPLR